MLFLDNAGFSVIFQSAEIIILHTENHVLYFAEEIAIVSSLSAFLSLIQKGVEKKQENKYNRIQTNINDISEFWTKLTLLFQQDAS